MLAIRQAVLASLRPVAPFRYGVAAYEAALWQGLYSAYSMKGPFLEQQLELLRKGSVGPETAAHSYSGWPWHQDGSWARIIEIHLEPWLRPAVARSQAMQAQRLGHG